jgi:manganese efflux pump family protein
MLPLLALAVGLAMDATAIAAAQGFAAPDAPRSRVLRLALLFGAFQAGMPLVGWAIGEHFQHAIESYQHWVAFALLAGIGAKMLHEVSQRSDDQPRSASEEANAFAWGRLTMLAIATSIDALVAGLTLPLLAVPIVTAVTVIGLITVVLSFGGVHLGRHFGARVGRKLDALGGVLLIGLGLKILLWHLLWR